MLRNVTESIKKSIAGRQYFKCANNPNSQLKGLENYFCPLWKSTDNTGCFDESGYEIDHIIELSISGDNDSTNLQALCKMCHDVKTKRFMQTKKIINDDKKQQLDNKNELDDIIETDIKMYNNFNQNSAPKRKPTRYVCKYCKAEFDRKGNYVRHMNRKVKCTSGKYVPGSNRHICTFCGKEYSRKNILMNHMKICEQSKNINCNNNNNNGDKVVNNCIINNNNGIVNNNNIVINYSLGKPTSQLQIPKNSIKKDLAIYLLNIFNRSEHVTKKNYDLIKEKINETFDPNVVSVIINSLICFLPNKNLDYNFLCGKIQYYKELNEFIENTF